jgi:dihydrofolate reductase
MFAIVVALAENNVIGDNNQLIWHLPADLQFFKKITMGKPIVMGRKTFFSIGKPLPGRRNIVITRDKNFSISGLEIFHSVEEVLTSFDAQQEVMIIGGAEIYRQFLPFVSRLYITRVHEKFSGDTFFPQFDYSEWKLISSEFHAKDQKNIYDFTFEFYERI